MMNLGDFGPDVSPEPKLAMLIHWKKVAEALFQTSLASTASKRCDFCRLPRAILSVASLTGFQAFGTAG
jgi:hypothetical protein